MVVPMGRLVLEDGTDWAAWSRLVAAVPGRRVRIDLSAVMEIDAAGVGLLARLAAQLRCQGRELEVVEASPRVRRTLELVGLDDALRLPPQAGPGGGPSREMVWPRCPEGPRLMAVG